MIGEGERAPRFALPGVRDGEIEQVSLAEYLGEDVVILAFYPGDFNPACSGGSTDLDELDLFTMQKDVSILGISGDSVFSHRAFADEYDLHIPLLSDARAEVAAKYGVDVADEGAGYLTRRAVVVIDPDETVEFAWVADDIDGLPDPDEIRAAVEGVGGDETAKARYRVGHAHYIEGRRAFTSAMQAYEDKEWMLAQGDFTRANEEFGEAQSEFNTANRFAEDETALKYFDRAERKAEVLWRAADWLSDSANAYASGEGGEAERLRKDAESPLETARDIHDPPDPDDFPPEEDPAEQEDEGVSILPDEDDEGDASLTVDIDDQAGEATTEEATTEEATSDGPPETDPSGGTASETATAASDDGAESADQAESDIDDAELEEIAAELEQQTENTQDEADAEIDDGNVVPDSIELGDGVGGGADTDGEAVGTESDTDGNGTTPETAQDRPDEQPDDGADSKEIDGELDEDDIELDLTDPTEGEGGDEADEDEDEDEEPLDDEFGDGDHGVPDSL